MITERNDNEALFRAFGYYGADDHGGIIASARVDSFVDLEGVKCHAEAGRNLYYEPRRRWYEVFRSPPPVYHALLPHLTFTGRDLEPVWVNGAGRASVAWLNRAGRRTLLIGLDVVGEMVRHRQGDPAKVHSGGYRGGFGFDYERPNYLFEDQIVPGFRTQPWADHLGFLLAEVQSRLNVFPLVEPLPGGARGAVVLTGDDDQAYLERYAEQLATIEDLPMTYFMHPLTRHTENTIRLMPAAVEFGLHPDALEQPEAYDSLCAEQKRELESLVGKPMRVVRNHGYLNQGYLGHLATWEDIGLKLDVNSPGVDGTTLNGSLLPMRIRRPDGTWSPHYSLLTLFGDGMISACELSPNQATERINQLARQIESDRPGVMVCNFHPENIALAKDLHLAAAKVVRRPGWIALGLETYLSWLEMLEGLTIRRLGAGRFLLTASDSVQRLVLRYPAGTVWHRQNLDPWTGQKEVIFE